ncbi:MAG TPA: hypothetical protein VL127_04130 [Bryobacteraceae bacterium]|nr:hypothetical protein [Bryobacteraceae bacterium]
MSSIKHLNQFFAEIHRQRIPLSGAIQAHPKYSALLFRFDNIGHKELIVRHAQHGVRASAEPIARLGTGLD